MLGSVVLLGFGVDVMLGSCRCLCATAGGTSGAVGPGEGAMVLGVAGDVTSLRLSRARSSPPAYMRQRCFTRALSTATAPWSCSSCRPWSSSLERSAFMVNMSSRIFSTWSLSRPCFWCSTFMDTASPRACTCLRIWSVAAFSAFCDTSSPRPWICRVRCSTFRTSALCARSSPSSRICLFIWSTRASSALCPVSSVRASSFLKSSSSLQVSARRASSPCRALRRSWMWSVVSVSTFLARLSLKTCSCLPSWSQRAAVDFWETSSLRAWICLASWSALETSTLEPRATFVACSWSAIWLKFASVAFCSRDLASARISRFRSSSRPSILSLTMPMTLSSCLICASTWSRRRSTSWRSSFWATTVLRSLW
mmetsp:Transcript_99202/g.319911  ORF Transcript_99202/g.319911 Transcript_99202/m.319911 type:complete len:368 (+) Transcript_99202:37-1140(+)